MADATAFADVSRVKQAGKGFYMHVTVGGKAFWTRINRDVYDTVSALLKERKKAVKADESAEA